MATKRRRFTAEFKAKVVMLPVLVAANIALYGVSRRRYIALAQRLTGGHASGVDTRICGQRTPMVAASPRDTHYPSSHQPSGMAAQVVAHGVPNAVRAA